MGESSPKKDSSKDSPVKDAHIELDDDDEKSHTFRYRRLTYTKHHLSNAAAAAAATALDKEEDKDDSVEKGRNFRKRRLTLGEKQQQDSAETSSSPVSKKQRRPELQSRIVHAGELLRQLASPSSLPENRLYHPPFRADPLETEEDRASKPAWRHRHTRHHSEEDHVLPFPRHVVGTYSCHGVEPVYDSDYEDVEDDDDDDDEDWVMPGEKVETKEAPSPTDCDKEEKKEAPKEPKLTTSAKINQDRGGVAYPYGNCPRTALFAAYDGHGQGGELVSQYALHEIQKRLEKHDDFQKDISTAFKEVFVNVDEDLKKEPLIEPLYAGTTACVVLIRDKEMTISNAGDSRAVLGRRKEEGKWTSLDLTNDHNPDVPAEKERIERSGGFVSPPPEVGLSARVWLDSSYSQIGLAMSRSIGDHAVAPVGVIAEPDVTQHTIEKDDDFIIIATDGVWEFIDSSEAVDIVSQHLEKEGATKACQMLIEAAAEKWHQEEGNYRDDITALVVRLRDLWDNKQ